MRKSVVLSLLIAVALVAVARYAYSQPDENLSDFMNRKLEHAQSMLEGLVTEDYPTILKHAREMNVISRAAAWQVIETPEYAAQSVEFRRAVDDLTKAAEKHNLDGAALAYVEMTVKCVNCHKYVRTIRVAEAPQFDGILQVAQRPVR